MAERCYECQLQFGLLQRRHNCVICGAAVCEKCSSRDLIVYIPDCDDVVKPALPTAAAKLTIVRIVGVRVKWLISFSVLPYLYSPFVIHDNIVMRPNLTSSSLFEDVPAKIGGTCTGAQEQFWPHAFPAATNDSCRYLRELNLGSLGASPSPLPLSHRYSCSFYSHCRRQ